MQEKMMKANIISQKICLLYCHYLIFFLSFFTNISHFDEKYQCTLTKHFYDSILALKHLENTKDITLLDIGSGAGLPGIVLKIAYPNTKITLLEPTTKRCNFLNYFLKNYLFFCIFIV